MTKMVTGVADIDDTRIFVRHFACLQLAVVGGSDDCCTPELLQHRSQRLTF